MSDAEPPQVYSHTQPKARKEHKCYECRGVIKAGETYHLHKGIWDHQADTFKVCNDCEDLRKAVDAGCDYDEVTPFGRLSESVSEVAYREGQPSFRDRFVAIMEKRCKSVHPSWYEGAGGAS